MGWYAKVWNVTKGEWSSNEWKYGQATLSDLLKAESTWDPTDVIVGGGMGEGYCLISGWDRYQITEERDETGFHVIEWDLVPHETDLVVTQCSCNWMITSRGVVVGYIDKGACWPNGSNMIHCSGCHRVWDGFAQCPCSV